jgi:hypothetical protein
MEQVLEILTLKGAILGNDQITYTDCTFSWGNDTSNKSHIISCSLLRGFESACNKSEIIKIRMNYSGEKMDISRNLREVQLLYWNILFSSEHPVSQGKNYSYY